jgi:hypothetical protein
MVAGDLPSDNGRAEEDAVAHRVVLRRELGDGVGHGDGSVIGLFEVVQYVEDAIR